jgi:hypothetical protein
MRQNHPVTTAIVGELTAAQSRVADDAVYSRRGGRSALQEQTQNYATQRQCFAHNDRATPYQPATSASLQGRAARAKTFTFN